MQVQGAINSTDTVPVFVTWELEYKSKQAPAITYRTSVRTHFAC